MNRVKSFEEMGREADRATRDASLALNWVTGLGSEEAAQAAVSVVIKGANWDDGTLRLQEKLTAQLRKEIGPWFQRAVREMLEDGRVAREQLVELMRNPPEPDLSRQVPRMVEAPPVPPITDDPAPGEQDQPPVPGEGNADTYATAFREMGQEARELLSWCSKNPGSRFARTPARDVLVAGGYLRQNGSGPNATWDLTDEGKALAAVA